MFASGWSQLTLFLSFYNVSLLLEGFGVTLVLSGIGCLIGFVAGFMLAVLQRSRSPATAPLRVMLSTYSVLFRRVPFLVTLMLVFFASQASGANLSTFAVAQLSACLIAAAYLGQIISGGLNSVHINQWEAALTLNFSYTETLRYVIVPQAWRVIVPPTFAFLVMFIKDTALASQIGVLELTSAGKVLNDKGFSAALVYATILALYFLMSYPLSRLGKHLEAKLAAPRNH